MFVTEICKWDFFPLFLHMFHLHGLDARMVMIFFFMLTDLQSIHLRNWMKDSSQGNGDNPNLNHYPNTETWGPRRTVQDMNTSIKPNVCPKKSETGQKKYTDRLNDNTQTKQWWQTQRNAKKKSLNENDHHRRGERSRVRRLLHTSTSRGSQPRNIWLIAEAH